MTRKMARKITRKMATKAMQSLLRPRLQLCLYWRQASRIWWGRLRCACAMRLTRAVQTGSAGTRSPMCPRAASDYLPSLDK